MPLSSDSRPCLEKGRVAEDHAAVVEYDGADRLAGPNIPQYGTEKVGRLPLGLLVLVLLAASGGGPRITTRPLTTMPRQRPEVTTMPPLPEMTASTMWPTTTMMASMRPALSTSCRSSRVPQMQRTRVRGL